MFFKNEHEFEEALINELTQHGWEKDVLKYKTENDLIDNWAKILFENNRQIDKLNNYPLTKGEIGQILNQIKELKTPVNLNGYINGKNIHIIRDNPDDKEHLGKDISLKIYDRNEIAAGQSKYQIAQQPRFFKTDPLSTDNRGDLLLLINGMPVIHVELKNSGHSVSEAFNQINRYRREGVFNGLFSLVQVFVAMEPNEMVYFANPGNDCEINPKNLFHWTNSQNEIYIDWRDIVSKFLYIPMAHELIGFYTVPDTADGRLKVMRPYQIYAAKAISSKVTNTRWLDNDIYGGYIWHTTGSGKTLTSYKSAQLIASSGKADKVVFLLDRIELGNQTLLAYRGFADDYDDVQETENTDILIKKLKDSNINSTLIVTSIQKMSRVNLEKGSNEHDISEINKKRIVFIIDECHRSTFGEMLIAIKETFPKAIFFGFSGTPIMDINKKKNSTTSDIFGDELARYTIADGIRDGNVLGFDPILVSTYDEKEMRIKIALEKAKAKTIDEAMKTPAKKKIFMHYTNLPMAGFYLNGEYIKGIEDYLPSNQFDTKEYRSTVVKDILDNWELQSVGYKFSGILATSSIREASQFCEEFERQLSVTQLKDFKYTCLFDPNYDCSPDDFNKEQTMLQILRNYNSQYQKNYSIPKWQDFKEDLRLRLARKGRYKYLDLNNDNKISELHKETLDLLIVVDQMLTGFDSKWVNTLYLSKMLVEDSLVQAFSRTNRPFGVDKPHGVVRYYKFPHTMRENIKSAFKHYSGENAYGVFALRLNQNVNGMNSHFQKIKKIFDNNRIINFSKLPELPDTVAVFVKEFKQLKQNLESAKLQGFSWKKMKYGSTKVDFDKNIYQILVQRYKEVFAVKGSKQKFDVPYDIKNTLTQLETEKIDSDYLNSNFSRYIKVLQENSEDKNLVVSLLKCLHQSFASLPQEEQNIAQSILNDVNNGNLIIEKGKTLRDYIDQYITSIKNDQIHSFAESFKLDEEKLRRIMKSYTTESNLNNFGRFDDLLSDVKDFEPIKKYFREMYNETIKPKMLYIKLYELVKRFILSGGFSIKSK